MGKPAMPCKVAPTPAVKSGRKPEDKVYVVLRGDGIRIPIPEAAMRLPSLRLLLGAR